jgi:hypothetical protein
MKTRGRSHCISSTEPFQGEFAFCRPLAAAMWAINDFVFQLYRAPAKYARKGGSLASEYSFLFKVQILPLPTSSVDWTQDCFKERLSCRKRKRATKRKGRRYPQL